jgi:hypothetical protein
LSLGRSKGRKAVQDRGPDLQFGHMSVEVACHNARSKQLKATHFRFDKTSSMIPAPAPPDRAAEASGGAEDLVSGMGARRSLQPWPCVLAGRYDSAGFARGDSRVACASVISSVSTDLANGLIGWDLAEQFGQPAKPFVLHGSRKLTIVRLAEAGCSDAQIQAITNQSPEMVAYYRKGANRKKLSKDAQQMMEQNKNKT